MLLSTPTAPLNWARREDNEHFPNSFFFLDTTTQPVMTLRSAAIHSSPLSWLPCLEMIKYDAALTPPERCHFLYSYTSVNQGVRYGRESAVAWAGHRPPAG